MQHEIGRNYCNMIYMIFPIYVTMKVTLAATTNNTNILPQANCGKANRPEYKDKSLLIHTDGDLDDKRRLQQ